MRIIQKPKEKKNPAHSLPKARPNLYKQQKKLQQIPNQQYYPPKIKILCKSSL